VISVFRLRRLQLCVNLTAFIRALYALSRQADQLSAQEYPQQSMLPNEFHLEFDNLSVEKPPPLESLRLKVLSTVLPEKEVRIRHRQDWRQDWCGSKAAICRSQLRHTRNENRSAFTQLD
jgi:hypothetical protein